MTNKRTIEMLNALMERTIKIHELYKGLEWDDSTPYASVEYWGRFNAVKVWANANGLYGALDTYEMDDQLTEEENERTFALACKKLDLMIEIREKVKARRCKDD